MYTYNKQYQYQKVLKQYQTFIQYIRSFRHTFNFFAVVFHNKLRQYMGKKNPISQESNILYIQQAILYINHVHTYNKQQELLSFKHFEEYTFGDEFQNKLTKYTKIANSSKSNITQSYIYIYIVLSYIVQTYNEKKYIRRCLPQQNEEKCEKILIVKDTSIIFTTSTVYKRYISEQVCFQKYEINQRDLYMNIICMHVDDIILNCLHELF
eukprot:TRINITY_DN24_c0_g1_i10.p1 TRINITY_DN24_c0_g1~~TRINITY_DN24_c0_g1_i10.p1  ORF type:complete len:210 (-),score=-14.22 TRINITY_DN24_c0_g1_i10:240-869(-)